MVDGFNRITKFTQFQENVIVVSVLLYEIYAVPEGCRLRLTKLLASGGRPADLTRRRPLHEMPKKGLPSRSKKLAGESEASHECAESSGVDNTGAAGRVTTWMMSALADAQGQLWTLL
jgi:hypothetical protein